MASWNVFERFSRWASVSGASEMAGLFFLSSSSAYAFRMISDASSKDVTGYTRPGRDVRSHMTVAMPNTLQSA